MKNFKRRLLKFARYRDNLSDVGNDFNISIWLAKLCDEHSRNCSHTLDAYSLALDGEDVKDLL